MQRQHLPPPAEWRQVQRTGRKKLGMTSPAPSIDHDQVRAERIVPTCYRRHRPARSDTSRRRSISHGERRRHFARSRTAEQRPRTHPRRTPGAEEERARAPPLHYLPLRESRRRDLQSKGEERTENNPPQETQRSERKSNGRGERRWSGWVS
jgi:hypothetical protein